MLDRRERGWATAADGHSTVNEVFADKAVARWGLRVRPTVVPNYPEPWTPPGDAPPLDLVRAATGLPPSTRICLFWGRLGPYVGLDEAAEAVLTVPDTALVLLGFGRGWERSVARDADPRYAGRHFTLPAVHPDELPAWVASADVALCTPPAAIVQPALHDPEQVPRGDGRRHADGPRPRPPHDGGSAPPRGPRARGRVDGPGRHRRRGPLDPRPARRPSAPPGASASARPPATATAGRSRPRRTEGCWRASARPIAPNGPDRRND